jgi:hypothetical protein
VFPGRYFAPVYWPGRYFPHVPGANGGNTHLTAAELLSMREHMPSTFPSRGFLRRKSVVSDSQGGETETWADVGHYLCRLRARSARESQEAERPVASTAWDLLLPWGTTVLPEDRFRIAGLDYEVADTDTPRSEQTCVRIPVRRVQ